MSFYHRRRGTIYVIVLSVALIVTVLGLSGLTLLRVHRRSADGSSDLTSAHYYARSGIEIGLRMIRSDVNWRTNLVNGYWKTNAVIGDGMYSLRGIDPIDGNLAGSDTDPVTLRGIGNRGQARRMIEVDLAAVTDPLTCLEVAACAGNELYYYGATATCDQIMSANASVYAYLASTISSDVEAGGTITGAGFLGMATTGINPRSVPGTGVFDYYVTNGTPINIASVPGQVIDRVVLSPANNPYGGTTNPEGIYVIDCGFQKLTIKDSRIVGTLVLMNCDDGSLAQASVFWQPAVSNYPSLLVGGGFSIMLDAVPLNEAGRSTNFNPPGTPYLGISDIDQLDSYPSRIEGLIYASGTLTTDGNTTIDGVIVAGNTVIAKNVLNLTYDPSFFITPPPGFTTPPVMEVVPGSWRQVVE